MNFGTQAHKEKFLPGVADGSIRFCLGITEPDGEPEFCFLNLLPMCTNTLQPAQMSPISKPPLSEKATITSSTVPRNGSQTPSGQIMSQPLCELEALEPLAFLF